MEIPECPEEMAYLVEYAYALFGCSGASMAGLLPVSHREMMAWSQAMDVRLEPHEFAAIRTLDAVLLNPDPPAEEQGSTEPHRPVIPVVPKRPEGVEPQFVIEED